jgi:hypothetical protein
MARSDIALQAIGEMLIQAFDDTVAQPLPPLILQLMRQLHEMTGGDEDDATEAPHSQRGPISSCLTSDCLIGGKMPRQGSTQIATCALPVTEVTLNSNLCICSFSYRSLLNLRHQCHSSFFFFFGFISSYQRATKS